MITSRVKRCHESGRGRWSSLFGYGRGTSGLPLGWEGRDKCGEFLLSWLVRGCEDREGRGGVEEEGSKKRYMNKKKWSDKRVRDKCHGLIEAESPDLFMVVNN